MSEIDRIQAIPKWLYPVMGTYLSFVFVFGLLVNITMLYVVFKSKLSVKNTRFAFNVSFYICNLIQITALLPMAIVSTFKQSWMFGTGGCTYYGFGVCFTSYVIISLFVTVAIYHYKMSVSKNRNKNSIDKSSVTWIVAACFVHGFLIAILPLFGWNSYIQEPFVTACSIDWQSRDLNNLSYSIFLLIEMWLIPVGMICFAYAKVCIEIFRSSRRLKRIPFVHRRRRRIIKVSIMLFSSFCLIWTPYACTSVYALVSSSSEPIPIVLQILPQMAAKSAVLVYPLVHMIMNEGFRVEIKKNLSCCSRGQSPVSDQLEMVPVNDTNDSMHAQTTSLKQGMPIFSTMVRSDLNETCLD